MLFIQILAFKLGGVLRCRQIIMLSFIAVITIVIIFDLLLSWNCNVLPIDNLDCNFVAFVEPLFTRTLLFAIRAGCLEIELMSSRRRHSIVLELGHIGAYVSQDLGFALLG